MKNEDLDLSLEMEPVEPRALSRREFFGVSGTGLFVLFAAHPLNALQETERIPTRQGYPADFNAYLRVGGDGRVTCMVGKIEMGQGVMTSLAQMLAHELDVRADAVDMIMGDTDQCPWDMGTFGSLSTRVFGPVLRAAGAEARAALLEMAAERLNAPMAMLEVKNGVVSAGGKQVTYAQLVGGKRIERHLKNAALKQVSPDSLLGQTQVRKDAVEKVTGRAVYAGDIKLPGLLHARLVRPPAHGAVLKTADTSAAEKIPGVRVARDGNLVAVLHERRDIADEALRLVKADFVPAAAGPNDVSIFDHLRKTAPAPRVVHESGNLADGEKAAATLVEETYVNSYVAHAPMETHTATAQFVEGKLTVWASTQTPFPLRAQLAQALALKPQEVRVITPYVGGGFGGKSAGQQAIEAARLAKATGVPVQVCWDRDEEFFFDTFRPAAVIKVRSGLTTGGKIPLWQFDGIGAGEREARQFYDIPHQRTTSAGSWSGGSGGMHPFAVGPWRAPSVNSNTFARESHIDVLAARAGADPVEFRLQHLTEPRMRRVLEAAARQFGWTAAKLPSRRGHGVACATDSGSPVATIAEVAIDRNTGHVQVKRVVVAQDAGIVVNPDGLRQQMEGCVTMGLGYALTEEIHFKNGEVLDGSFASYPLPRFSWLPKIETVVIDNPDLAPQGGGEPAIVTMGAVIANAIFDASGARLLQLPMTPERVKAALLKL